MDLAVDLLADKIGRAVGPSREGVVGERRRVVVDGLARSRTRQDREGRDKAKGPKPNQ